MATAYHVNAKGEPGKCGAQAGKCPFGSAEEHHSSPEKAREAFEASQKEGTFATHTKSVPADDDDTYDEAQEAEDLAKSAPAERAERAQAAEAALEQAKNSGEREDVVNDLTFDAAAFRASSNYWNEAEAYAKTNGTTMVKARRVVADKLALTLPAERVAFDRDSSTLTAEQEAARAGRLDGQEQYVQSFGTLPTREDEEDDEVRREWAEAVEQYPAQRAEQLATAVKDFEDAKASGAPKNELDHHRFNASTMKTSVEAWQEVQEHTKKTGAPTILATRVVAEKMAATLPQEQAAYRKTLDSLSDEQAIEATARIEAREDFVRTWNRDNINGDDFDF